MREENTDLLNLQNIDNILSDAKTIIESTQMPFAYFSKDFPHTVWKI